jgi:hypothetical protein
MRFQVLQDGNGNDTDIPIKEWVLKAQFPQIESVNAELPVRQKMIIEERLKLAASNPNTIQPIDGLLEELDG